MKSILISLCLICVILMAQSKWSEPELVMKGFDGSSASIYNDNRTGNSYVFYGYKEVKGDETTPFLCYKAFMPGVAAPKEKCVKQTRIVMDVSASGDNDGKRMYVAFSAKRNINGASCTSSTPEGCVDVYFTETKNEGADWSEPVAISRAGMTDVKDRWNPKLISVYQKNRLFLAFLKGEYNDKTPDLFISSRPDQSKVFNNEMDTDISPDGTNFDFTYTFSTSFTLLHIVLKDNDMTGLIRFTSQNNGVSWKSWHVRRTEHDFTFSMSATPDRRELYVLSLNNVNTLGIYWVNTDLMWFEESYTLKSQPAGYKVALAAISGYTHKAIIMAPLEIDDSQTILFDSKEQTMTDLKDNAPLYLNPETRYFNVNGVIGFRVLIEKDGNLYTATYTLP